MTIKVRITCEKCNGKCYIIDDGVSETCPLCNGRGCRYVEESEIADKRQDRLDTFANTAMGAFLADTNNQNQDQYAQLAHQAYLVALAMEHQRVKVIRELEAKS